MSKDAPPRALLALRIVLPIFGILLLVQYVVGLATNVYAPAGGFTSNSSFNYLDAHYNVGFALGFLGIALVIVAAWSRQMRFIVLSVIALLGVIVAGVAGMAFVGTQPNPPSASITMGIAFLVAFWASTMMGFMIMMSRPMSGPPPAPGPASS